MVETKMEAGVSLFPNEYEPNKWKINDAAPVLKPGEYVTFHAGGVVVKLWLPDTSIFVEADEISVIAKEPLTLQIADDKTAKDGWYPYGMFVVGTNVMVEGNSPPYIRIKKTDPTGIGGG